MRAYCWHALLCCAVSDWRVVMGVEITLSFVLHRSKWPQSLFMVWVEKMSAVSPSVRSDSVAYEAQEGYDVGDLSSLVIWSPAYDFWLKTLVYLGKSEHSLRCFRSLKTGVFRKKLKIAVKERELLYQLLVWIIVYNAVHCKKN